MVDEQLGKAIPFIAIDQRTGEFQVTSHAMVFLESLPRNAKVQVVAIAGPYRTGKSFLANRLLNQSTGFEIGSTTQACTKGIWIWNKPVETAPDQIMLLLDTEGLASTERSTNVDIKIFSLSLLLASLFIYNQMGPITENAIEELSLVVNLTNYIRITQNKNSDQDFKNFFPQFFWVLRDFYHDLEGQTPKQYLEECLQPSPGLSSEVLKKNGIREAITKYFKERDCFTLVRPVTEESKLAHIDSLKFEDLKTEFRKGVTAFLKEVRKRLKAKSVNGKVLNPSMFLQLALEYTESINHKETPTVLTAIDRVVQAEANKIQDETFDTFSLQLDTLIHEDNVPMPKQLFSRLVRQTFKRNLTGMQKQMAPILSFGEVVKESEKFSSRTRDIVARKVKQNYSASYFLAVSMLNKLYASVSESFPSDDKAVSAALENVRKWHSLLKEYKEHAKCILQWEVAAESLVKSSDPVFIRPEFIDRGEGTGKDLGDVQDEISTAYSTSMSNATQVVLAELDSYGFDILSKTVDTVVVAFKNQHDQLKQTLAHVQQEERRLGQKKKQNEQFVELQKNQNDDLREASHDLEVKLEGLKRELQSRSEEIDSLKQVKDLEQKGLKKNFELQLREKDDELKQLEAQKTQYEQVFQTTQGKAQELDSEKRKEVSQVQNEIKKLEQDVEELKNKMKNKENNPHFMQVNQFFSEVKDYLEQYKKIFAEQDSSKKQKSRLFALQKQLNDQEYQGSQSELALKKQLDEKLRLRKEQLEQSLEPQLQQIDQNKAQGQILLDKKQLYEQQVENLQSQIQDAQDKLQVVRQQKESAVIQVQTKQSKLDELRSSLAQVDAAQRSIEEQIYMISIENKQKEEDKEIILMLLPQVLKAINGKANNIKSFMAQFENETTKAKVVKLFHAFKIPYK